MNNQRSFGEQLLQTLILAGIGFFVFKTFFNQTGNSTIPPRPAPALVKAFQGIAPDQGPPLAEAPARAEIKKLSAEIEKNPKDPLAQWDRLRTGLIQQYVLNELDSQERKGGILGLGAKVKYFPTYDDIVQNAAGDAVEAQALYQGGDLLWRQSLQKDGKASNDAANALDALIHRGRGMSAFLDSEIYVPKEKDPAKVPLDKVPADGFDKVKVRDLHGTLTAPNPQGILDRLNQFYSDTPLYKLFDSVVQALGANPTFSYGLTILIFAIGTRSLMQPIYRRQYDSMKGMAVIAPEMKKIQEKYKGKSDQDAQMKMIKETRELQKRHGVNPMVGCGLSMLQMPIFFFFVYPMIQHYEPKMELSGASFLWIHALSRPDIPLLIMYGISMFLSFRLSSTPPTDDMQRQQQMIMSFMFPFVFPLFLISYPAAFTMYWMTYNMMSTAFQWRLLKAADPNKNVIKTLMGDMSSLNPTADAVPARPKKEESLKNEQSMVTVSSPEKKNAKAKKSGSSSGNNGHLNGKVKRTAPGDAVLTPSDEEG